MSDRLACAYSRIPGGLPLAIDRFRRRKAHVTMGFNRPFNPVMSTKQTMNTYPPKPQPLVAKEEEEEELLATSIHDLEDGTESRQVDSGAFRPDRPDSSNVGHTPEGFQRPNSRELFAMGASALAVVVITLAAGLTTVFDWVI